MILRPILHSSIAVSLVVGMAASTLAAVVFSDNFNDDSGDLTGQKATTGQVWADQTASWNTGTLQTKKRYGQSDSVGAGVRKTESGTVWKGNVIPLGTTISDGNCVLAVDIKQDNGVVESCAALDSVHGQEGVTLIWSGTNLKCGGNMWSGALDMGIAEGKVHIELVLQLDRDVPTNSTALLRYTEIGNPSNHGSLDLGHPRNADPNGSGAFEFSVVALHVLRQADSQIGYDNISVIDNIATVPELRSILAKTRRLLLDDRIIEQLDNAVLRVGKVTKHPANPLFSEEFEWEPRFDNLYPNVRYDDEEELYKIWYFTWTYEPATSDVPRDQRIPGTYMKVREASDFNSTALRDGLGYATSKDGIHWEKPLMDVSPWKGQPSNLVAQPCHGAGVFKDMRERDPARRYKMFVKGGSMSVRFSPDGIHWGPTIACPEINAAGDTHNNAFWVPELKKYVGITRNWDRQRLVCRTESVDFIHWTKAEEVLRGKQTHQTYSMPIIRHGGVYLGVVAILRTEEDRTHTELTWSPDTVNWHRIDPGSPLIPNSEQEGDYDWGTAYASFPILLDNEIRIYYGACNAGHFDWRDGYLCLATLRPDGFAGYEPIDASQPGVVFTKPITLGAELSLTADAQGGSITVALVDEAGKVLLTSQPVTSNVTDEPVSWIGGGTLEKLTEQQARLRFTIKGAKLYSFVL